MEELEPGIGDRPSDEQMERLTKTGLIAWLLEPNQETPQSDYARFAGRWPDLYENRDYWVYFTLPFGVDLEEITPYCFEDVHIILLGLKYDGCRLSNPNPVHVYRMKVKKEEMVLDLAMLERRSDDWLSSDVGHLFDDEHWPHTSPDVRREVYHSADYSKAEKYVTYWKSLDDWLQTPYSDEKILEMHRKNPVKYQLILPVKKDA